MSCGKVAEGNDVIEPKGKILVSGLVGSVSGAGMGGNTHTKYYLELEEVEIVR
jgi:hypothetical protein